VEENLYVRSGSEFEASGSSTIYLDGHVDFDPGSTFDDGGDTLHWMGGNWYGDGALTINPTGLVIAEDLNSTWKYFYDSKFNNLTIEYNTRLYGTVNMNGDLNVERPNGGMYIQTYNNDKIVDLSGTGSCNFGYNAGIYVFGPDGYPDGFATYTADPTSYAYYQGTLDQTIRGAQYGHLRMWNNNDKTLDGDIDVLNHIYIYDYVDFYSNNFDIECAGNWYNQYLGEFYCGTGKVTMDGTTGNRIVYVTTSLTKSFYDLEINNDPTYYVYPNDRLDVLNDLTVIQGRFYPNNQTIEVGNNMVASGTGYWWNTNGTYLLTKPSGSANIGFNNGTAGSVTLGDGTTTTTYTLLDKASIYNQFEIKDGVTFNGNGENVEFRGNGDAIAIDGIYQMGPGGNLQMETNSTLQVNAGGALEAVGNSSNTVTITNNTGRYNFNVEGKISAQYALFEYMDNEGVVVGPTGWVDSTDNFSYCTFNNCDVSGACLTIENTQDFTDSASVPGNFDPWITDASFPTNPFGGASNVRKAVAVAGNVQFFNSTGSFEGEDYDSDPSDLIHLPID
jgi:hypothetical protein